jgi:serine/threonine protein kinase
VEFDTIGKYKVLLELGRGSMGVVYKAHDPVLNRFVAIKTISPSLGADGETRKRFLREAQSAARLNHPNIVTVYDLGEEHGRVYMAMELLEGQDLRQLIGTPAAARMDDKLRIMEQVCDGLAFAHLKNVVHRDLKPANIHVQPNGSVKIVDFGLARLGPSEMTATGTSIGTPNYMSPEQVKGAKADARSDVFSMGTVFYELLTGRKAFDAGSLHSILRMVAESEPVPARRLVPDMPAILVRLLERALAKDAGQRFRNAGEMRLALGVVTQVLAGQLEEAEGLELLEPSDEAEATAIMDGPPDPGARSGAPGPPTAREASRRGLSVSSASTFSRIRKGTGPGSSMGRKKTGPSDTLPPGARGAAPASRTGLYAGLGGVLVLVVAGGFWVWRGRAPSAPPAVSTEQVGALTEALVTSQVELAQESLRDKDYAGAIAQAQQALKLDAQNADARQVVERAGAILKEADDAASEARAAVQAGETDTAARALARLLAISPSHPQAGELASKLNQYFRGQAEEARTALTEARTAAERGQAGSQKPFADATAAGREAERLFSGGQFAVATRKFLEGRDGFAKALRAAEAAQQAQARRTPPPVTVASSSAAPLTAPSFTPPPVAPSAVAPTPTAPASLFPSATPSVLAPVRPSPPATVVGDDTTLVKKVVEDYARAIQAKDIAMFRAVKPNLSADEEKRLRAIFKLYKSYKVDITISSIQLAGAEARVRVSRQDTIDGNPIRLQQLLTMAKGAEGWTIRDIGTGQ